ncbi:hypothetical protein [Aeoliella sp. SH292]|uniref:hypothetical protein n=1 Tax=Aeoliella sp. SH292 TaxID=3454464 RepID=UPI003F9A207D
MTFVIPAPTPTTSATASSAAPNPKPKPQPTASTQDDDFGLSDLGGGLPDLGGDLDDFLAEDSPNPFQSPMTMSTPAATPMNRAVNTRGQMNTLANGIKLVFWGTASIVIAWIVTVLGFLLNTAIIVFAAPIIVLVGIVVATIGRVVCLGGPSKGAGRGLLIASVACDLFNFTSVVLVLAQVLPREVNPISGLLGLATLILFVLFIKSFTRSIGQPQLADDAKAIIVLICATIGFLFATPIAVLVFPLLAIVTGLGIFVTGLWGFFKYLNLLQHTAEAIRR